MLLITYTTMIEIAIRFAPVQAGGLHLTAKIFWGVMILDTVALLVLSFMASKGPSTPEGPVGGWLVLIPPILMIGIAGLVLLTKSERVMMLGIYILGGPWIFVVAGPIYSAFQKYQTDRSIAGDNDFRRGSARNLAHAITAGDLALVKSLIPLVGDINKQHGDSTFLYFAVSSTQVGSAVPPATIEIVKALLDAGAKADQPVAYRRWPLTHAMYSGPELTELLLKAGANPNHLDDAKRPLWWQVLSNDTERGLQTLQILLDNGADLSIRDSESGPVGWAADHARATYQSGWRAVLMLIEHGASYKDEQRFGEPITRMLARELEDRGIGKREIPESLLKVKAFYEAK